MASVVDEVIQKHVPTEVQRLSRLRNLWLDLFPDRFSDHVWPMFVQGERLIVHVHDSQWLHEMTYWRQDVLRKLEAEWPESGVETLAAYVGPIPPANQRRPPEPPPPKPIDREPVLEPDIPPETLSALNGVADPGLREILAQARMMLGKPRGRGGSSR